MVAGNGGGAASSDEWALRYINVNYVRNLMEAFDEDASGFVTIKEANDFTCSRPLDWRWVLRIVSGATRSRSTQPSALAGILGHW